MSNDVPGNPSGDGANRIAGLVDRLLDRGYAGATRRTMAAIQQSVNSGIIAQRLNELDNEVARLAADGEKLTADNPVVRALVADMDDAMRRNAALIGEAAPALAEGAEASAAEIARTLTVGGLDDAQLARFGIQWNRPDPEAVNAAVGYLESSAWADEIGAYSERIINVVRNQATYGIVNGWGPLRSAAAIRRSAEGLPVYQAQSIMRTLQLESYRAATAIHQRANADILDGQIRVGTLDDRICMACLALHGTPLPVGEKVQDHHQGRCTSVGYIRGITPQVTTGEAWFASLPEERRLTIAGPGAYEMLRSGRAQLRDFVVTYEDPVYGQMVRQATLESLER